MYFGKPIQLHCNPKYNLRNFETIEVVHNRFTRSLINSFNAFFSGLLSEFIAENISFSLNFPYSDSTSNPRLHFLRAFSNEF